MPDTQSLAMPTRMAYVVGVEAGVGVPDSEVEAGDSGGEAWDSRGGVRDSVGGMPPMDTLPPMAIHPINDYAMGSAVVGLHHTGTPCGKTMS